MSDYNYNIPDEEIEIKKTRKEDSFNTAKL